MVVTVMGVVAARVVTVTGDNHSSSYTSEPAEANMMVRAEEAAKAVVTVLSRLETVVVTGVPLMVPTRESTVA